MTDESKAKLLQAYRAAVEAEQDVIADMIEDVILDVMGGGTPSTVTRGTQNTLEPPWRVEATPLSVPMTYTVNTATESTGIDHTTREVTS